jgi:hydrogenase maturation protease
MTRTLVLAMGNDILGDDGVGLQCARRLRVDRDVEIVETAEAGLALLEYIEGYDRVLILDAILTRQHPVGTILRYGASDFRSVVAPSPHYAGLPEVLALGEQLRVKLPASIVVLAMEVEDPYSIREWLSPRVDDALHAYVETAEGVLAEWGLDVHSPMENE